jgi:hypothetical protein
MTTDAEMNFVEQVGRHYSRHYAVPPMTGRVMGWLLICDPPQQTVAEIADALHASRSAIGSAISMLETWGSVQRSRVPGERADRIALHFAGVAGALEAPAEYGALAALARHGIAVLENAPPERRSRLVEMAAFAEFLLEAMPRLADEWSARRAALLASGDLPEENA